MIFLGIWASLIIAPLTLASSPYLIAIPPFREKTGYPLLSLGLQQMLIDDLNAGLAQGVMGREEIADLFKAGGKMANTPLYVVELKKYSGTLPAHYVLLDNFIEREGDIVWEARLHNVSSGDLVKEWVFEGKLYQAFSLEEKIVNALRTELSSGNVLKGKGTKERDISPNQLSSLLAFSKGIHAYDSGNYPLAARLFRDALTWNKDFYYAERQLNLLRSRVEKEAVSQRELGLFLLADGQKEKSERYLKNACEQNKNDADALLGLSQIDMEKRQYQSAQEKALKAQAVKGENFQSLITLGTIYKSEGKTQKAIAMFEKAKDIEPSAIDAHQNLAQLYEANGQNKKASQEYLKTGELYGRELNLEKAQDNFSGARRLDPKDYNSVMKEGDLCASTGDNKEALRLYDDASVLSPANDKISQRTGDIYRRMGEKGLAQEEYHKALGINPDNFQANLGVGKLAGDENRHELAVTYLEKAKKIDPNSLEAGMALAEAYSKLGGEDKESREMSLMEYKRLSQLSPNDPVIYKSMGDAIALQGDFTSAKTHYEKAIGLDPDYSEAYSGLAKIHERLGNKQESELMFSQAKLINPHTLFPGVTEEIHEGVRRLVESFPNLKTLAPKATLSFIDTGIFVEREGRWKKILDFLKIKRVRIQRVRNELQAGFQQRYDVALNSEVERIFSEHPYNAMKIQDMKSDAYLVDLCTHLKSDGALFYRITNKGLSIHDTYEFTVTALLFEKAARHRWINDIKITYLKKEMEYFNKPLLLGILLIFILGSVCSLRYIAQGSGDLRVEITRDTHANKAYFSVVISKKADIDLTRTKNALIKNMQKLKEDKKQYVRKVRYNRFEQSMVFRDTLFKRIHAGDYYVYLYGIIEDPSGDQKGNYQMTQQVAIEKNKRKELVFDLRTHSSHVEVKVFYKNQLAKGAEVSLMGTHESKFVKDELGVFFRLPLGKHTFLITYNGMTCTKEIDIKNLEEDFSFSVYLQENS